MKNELLQKILDLHYNGELLGVDDYFSGNTGAFDIDTKYYQNYDYNDVRYSDNKVEEICKIAIEMAEDNLDDVKKLIGDSNITDTELLLYSAWNISKQIKNIEDKYNAMWHGEEYSSETDVVEYYGSKTKAFDKGYDKYMEDHVSFGDNYLDCILDIYDNKINHMI